MSSINGYNPDNYVTTYYNQITTAATGISYATAVSNFTIPSFTEVQDLPWSNFEE